MSIKKETIKDIVEENKVPIIIFGIGATATALLGIKIVSDTLIKIIDKTVK